MAKECEDTDVDPKLIILVVSGVHEKLATGRYFCLQPGIWLSSKEERKELEKKINSRCHSHPLCPSCWKQGRTVSEKIMMRVEKS